ncbi:MAG: hypothetical protein KatS3mg089_0940 [Patescibacteria group bacterium]|nr:MAG: hypothetical protein KatS3mg089_0940 [Patescibacteria group bacterium]
MKHLYSFILIGAFFLLPGDVHAQTRDEILSSCFPLFGGGQTFCQQSKDILIDKKLLSPAKQLSLNENASDSDFVDNVTPDGTVYLPNQLTAVRLFITNTSNRELKDIKVEDLLPLQYINFVKSDGQYDPKTKTVKATIQSLKPKETKTLTILLQTVQADQLPQEVNALCVVNQARVNVGREQSQDNSQLCIQPQIRQQAPASQPPSQPPTTKGGLPLYTPSQPQKTPNTGASLITLVSLLTSTLAGFLLRKKIK